MVEPKVIKGFRLQLHHKSLKERHLLRTLYVGIPPALEFVRKSNISSAGQKVRMGLFIRTIGLARANVKIALANLTYNFTRFAFWERKRAFTA